VMRHDLFDLIPPPVAEGFRSQLQSTLLAKPHQALHTGIEIGLVVIGAIVWLHGSSFCVFRKRTTW